MPWVYLTMYSMPFCVYIVFRLFVLSKYKE